MYVFAVVIDCLFHYWFLSLLACFTPGGDASGKRCLSGKGAQAAFVVEDMSSPDGRVVCNVLLTSPAIPLLSDRDGWLHKRFLHKSCTTLGAMLDSVTKAIT